MTAEELKAKIDKLLEKKISMHIDRVSKSDVFQASTHEGAALALKAMREEIAAFPTE